MELFKPMSPLLVHEIPLGSDWGYQLKWDGYRIIAWIYDGKAELYTKRMNRVEDQFVELAQQLAQLQGPLLLDGEAVILDPLTGMPNFQMMQHRKRKDADHPVQYMVFDLLRAGEVDLRRRAFSERHRKLQELAADWQSPLHTVNLFYDGEALWDWVSAKQWEGIVCKRLPSPYSAGKNHRDWVKRKTGLQLRVEIVGILLKNGAISSLIMRRDGYYFGRNSSGLNEEAKTLLAQLPADKNLADYFAEVPEGLQGAEVKWLTTPLAAEVAGSKFTEAGTLRNPRILSLSAPAPVTRS